MVALARSGQPGARARLIDAHRRTVAQVAKRYSQSDLSSAERFRLGEQGLGEAIDRFEPSKGFTFSTYAIWHIRRAILGGMHDGGGTAGAREPRAPRPTPGVDAASLTAPLWAPVHPDHGVRLLCRDVMPYDEFGLFSENASEYGLPYLGPPAVRRVDVEVSPGRKVSSLVWGTSPPELVLVHGGAQNAHTWDTMALALGRPLLAIDLPGHGHSDGGRDGSLSVAGNGEDLATVIAALAPDAVGVVGMSLGGLSSIALAAHAPDLVRALVLVDVTPGVNPEKSAPITAFVDGPASFANFDELLARTIEHNPTRTVSSLRRGILHNAEQREDGSWVWRYARFRLGEGGRPEFGDLWGAVSDLTMPIMLVRGLAWSVVDDADVAELLRRQPTAKVVNVEGAGHSIQGDRPLELASIVSEFLFPQAG
jgi:pimeloyl-ACP methyl ester carboxylesterase